MTHTPLSGTEKYVRTDMPNFNGAKAFVLGGAFAGSIREFMLEAGFEGARSIIEADVVVFSGGADINPAMYGESPVREVSYWDDNRDEFEKRVYERCLRDKKMMFGICRGAQILHVLHGGKLYQHVEGHDGRDHAIVDIEDDVRVMATSIHHQMLRPFEGMQTVAIAEEQVSKRFVTPEGTYHATDVISVLEIEAAHYPSTGTFVVQGHPEVGSAEYRSWTMNKLHDFYMEHKKKRLEVVITNKQQEG